MPPNPGPFGPSARAHPRAHREEIANRQPDLASGKAVKAEDGSEHRLRFSDDRVREIQIALWPYQNQDALLGAMVRRWGEPERIGSSLYWLAPDQPLQVRYVHPHLNVTAYQPLSQLIRKAADSPAGLLVELLRSTRDDVAKIFPTATLAKVEPHRIDLPPLPYSEGRRIRLEVSYTPAGKVAKVRVSAGAVAPSIEALEKALVEVYGEPKLSHPCKAAGARCELAKGVWLAGELRRYSERPEVSMWGGGVSVNLLLSNTKTPGDHFSVFSEPD